MRNPFRRKAAPPIAVRSVVPVAEVPSAKRFAAAARQLLITQHGDGRVSMQLHSLPSTVAILGAPPRIAYDTSEFGVTRYWAADGKLAGTRAVAS